MSVGRHRQAPPCARLLLALAESWPQARNSRQQERAVVRSYQDHGEGYDLRTMLPLIVRVN